MGVSKGNSILKERLFRPSIPLIILQKMHAAS